MSDFNRSGTRSSDDVTAFATAWYAADPDAPESSGWVSHPDAAAGGHDNTIGYCGYVFNPETGDYTVRFRTYMPSLGRWGERDPIDYVDGLNTYLALLGSPIEATDDLGLDGNDDWMLHLNDHGGPHFQRGTCRYRVSDLSPIMHKGITPAALTDAEKLAIVEKYGKDILKRFPDSVLAKELKAALAEKGLEELRKRGQKCFTKAEVSEILERVVKKIEKEAAEEATRRAAQAAGAVVKGIGKNIIKKALPPILIALFVRDAYANGIGHAVCDTIIPVDIVKDLADKLTERINRFEDDGQYNVLYQRFLRAGYSPSEAAEMARSNSRSCDCDSSDGGGKEQ